MLRIIIYFWKKIVSKWGLGTVFFSNKAEAGVNTIPIKKKPSSTSYVLGLICTVVELLLPIKRLKPANYLVFIPRSRPKCLWIIVIINLNMCISTSNDRFAV